MTDRWRKPATLAAVEDDPQRIYHDGNVYRYQVDKTYDAESLARLRLGYLCLRCDEPQEQAMPTSCSLCGYAMHEYQTRDIAAEFEGTKHIGPSVSVDDEIEAMRERKRREQLGETIWTPPSAA